MTEKIVCFFFALTLLVSTNSCGKAKMSDNSLGLLDGIWIETFQFEDNSTPLRSMVFQPNRSNGVGANTSTPETTRVTFFENSYTIEVSHPSEIFLRRLSDSLYTEFRQSRIKSGSFGIAGDTLLLFGENTSPKTRLLFNVQNDSLFLKDIGTESPHKFEVFVTSSMIWGWSVGKTSGMLRKVN